MRTALFRRCRQSAGARAWVRGVVLAVIWPPQPLTPGRLLAVAAGFLFVGGWRPTVGSVAPHEAGLRQLRANGVVVPDPEDQPAPLTDCRGCSRRGTRSAARPS